MEAVVSLMSRPHYPLGNKPSVTIQQDACPRNVPICLGIERNFSPLQGNLICQFGSRVTRDTELTTEGLGICLVSRRYSRRRGLQSALPMPNLDQIWPCAYSYVPSPLCIYFADSVLRTLNKSMPTCANHRVFASPRARLSIIDVLNMGKLTLRLSTCLPRCNASSCLFTTREIL